MDDKFDSVCKLHFLRRKLSKSTTHFCQFVLGREGHVDHKFKNYLHRVSQHVFFVRRPENQRVHSILVPTRELPLVLRLLSIVEDINLTTVAYKLLKF